MMKKKINYVITTWSGPRREPNDSYLKKHLIKLLSLKNNLTQITIVKPIAKNFNQSYYDVENIIKEFDCKVEILEKYDNKGHSYGQFFYAFEKFRNNFDYYIFIEDDYIPNVDFFDELLLQEYLIQDVKGFLCSFSGINPNYPKGGCAVSNGLISLEYFEKIYSQFPNPINLLDGPEPWNSHYNFGELLKNCDFEFKDFAYKYRVPYYGDKIIHEYGRTDTEDTILVPYQLFDVNLNFEKMSYEHLDKFLLIRNLSKDFLHNNTEFTFEDVRKWFYESKPNYYVIKLGNKVIGYFRTSNFENDSCYLGCDLDPTFRGYGLAYTSYLQFMHKLFSEYNLNSIKLEVLSNNIIAKNLYNKLGFKVIGISDKKIIRNGEELESIIMEIKK